MKLLQSILLSLLMGITVVAHAAKQEVQVDLLISKITAALKAERPADALPFFAELEGMEPSLKKPLPESFNFYYIDTLDKTGDKAKAHSRADVYLNKYGKNGKYYGQVIEIMGKLQMQIDREEQEAAEKRDREEKEAAEQRDREEKARADAEATAKAKADLVSRQEKTRQLNEVNKAAIAQYNQLKAANDKVKADLIAADDARCRAYADGVFGFSKKRWSDCCCNYAQIFRDHPAPVRPTPLTTLQE